MDTKDLELAVIEMIRKLYNAEYNGKIKITQTLKQYPNEKDEYLNLGYLLELGLNKDERPITLAFEGTSEQFLKFIFNELKHNRYHYTDYFTAEKIYCNKDGCCKKK